MASIDMQKVRRRLIEFEQEFDAFGALNFVLTHRSIVDRFWANVITFAPQFGLRLPQKVLN